VFHALSRYTVKQASLTIVTNEYLASLVTEWGGRAFVLPDPIPDLTPEQGQILEKTTKRPRVTWVCTYSGDEPVEEVLKAVEASDKAFDLFVTSNPPAWVVSRVAELNLGDRVHLAGFLPHDEYIGLLATSDVVMVLTTLEHCLTCGAYEATSLERPMILSDTDALRTHFSQGAVYVEPNRDSIASGINRALDSRKGLAAQTAELKQRLTADWEQRRHRLERQLARPTARQE
jgi:glycosyltransferase involved in cell wall biosynthesis